VVEDILSAPMFLNTAAAKQQTRSQAHQSAIQSARIKTLPRKPLSRSCPMLRS